MTSKPWRAQLGQETTRTPRLRMPSALQDLEADADLLLGLGRERDPDRVADPEPEQGADADRALDGAAAQPARLGDAEVQRAVDRVGELLVGGDGEEDVGRLHRHLIFAEIMVLEQPDMVERALDQRLGAGLAIFFEQVALEAAGIDPDPDRAAIGLGGVDHLAHPLGRADIAGIDAQAGGAGVGGLERALVVEMDVGDDRHPRGADDLPQRRGRFLVGAGDPDDVRARFLAAADLVDRRPDVGGDGVGHGLHRDRRVAADRHGADHDLAGRTARDVAPRADAHPAHIGG